MTNKASQVGSRGAGTQPAPLNPLWLRFGPFSGCRGATPRHAENGPNKHKQKELNQANYLVAKDIFSILNVTASKTNHNFLRINSSLNAINDMLQNLSIDIIILNMRSELDNLFQCFQAQVTIWYQDIDSLQNAILFSRKNVLHPTVINTKGLKTTLASIKLDDTRKWISDILSDEIKLLINNCELETYSLPKQILFIIRVPVVESTIYSIYLCFPFPILLSNNTYFYINPFSQYFVIDTPKSQYAYLSNLDQCHTVMPNHYMCTLTNLYHAASQFCSSFWMANPAIVNSKSPPSYRQFGIKPLQTNGYVLFVRRLYSLSRILLQTTFSSLPYQRVESSLYPVVQPDTLHTESYMLA